MLIVKNNSTHAPLQYILPDFDKPFVDRLVVTNQIDNCMLKPLSGLLIHLNFIPDNVLHAKIFKHDEFKKAVVNIRRNNGANQQSISFTISGQAIRVFEQKGYYKDLIKIIESSPHSITKLDLSIDVNDKNLADVILSIRMYEHQHKKLLKFSRKQQTGRTFQQHISATKKAYSGYMIGKTTDNISGKIYDKKIEMAYQQNTIIDPRIRYEITFNNKNIPTTTDLKDPSTLFYYHAPKMLFNKIPKDIQKWEHDSNIILQPWVLPQRLADSSYQIAVKKLNRTVKELNVLLDGDIEEIDKIISGFLMNPSIKGYST